MLILFDAAILLLETCILVQLCNYFLQAKERCFILRMLITISLHVMISHFIPDSNFRLLVNLATDLGFVAFCWRGMFYQKILLSGLFYLLLMALDLIIIILYPINEINIERVYIFGALATRTIALLLLYCATRKIKKLIATMPFILIAILLMAIRGFDMHTLAFTNLVVLLAAASFIFIVIVLISSLKVRLEGKLHEIRADAETAAREQQTAYAHALIESYNSLRHIRHDFHHHISTLTALIEKNNFKAAKLYTEALSHTLGEPVIQTGNILVDAILHAKSTKIHELQIQVLLDAELPTELPINIVDLSIIISNALENAINACQTLAVEKRKIELTIIYDGWLLINIKNPYNEGASEVVKGGSMA